MIHYNICSIVLEHTEVRDIDLQFETPVRDPFLKSGILTVLNIQSAKYPI